MKYSKYFGGVLKNQGIPHLNTRQWARMMNIVAVENKIDGLNIAKKKYENTNLYYQYDIIIFKHDVQITDLTGNLDPSKLMDEMIKMSRE